MEKFIELGKTFGLEGAELLSLVEKRREEEREEKQRKEEEKKKRRKRDVEGKMRRGKLDDKSAKLENFKWRLSFTDKRWKPKKLREDMS